MYALKRGEGMKIGKKQTTAFLLAGAVFLFVNGIKFQQARTETWETQTVSAVQNTPYGWEKISSYTTYYNANDRGRCENIAIAAELINGATLQPYGEFSFNKTVGRRTQEAGFRQAKIIVNGEYVLGVGGGVCQVCP